MSDKQPSLTMIRNRLKDAGWVWFKSHYSVNLVGWRSADLQANTYNDWMTCSWLDEHGMWFFRRWPITTDPGVYWRKHPMNPGSGTGILKPGQYRGLWKLGQFKGRYQALLQAGPCTLWRDNDRNETIDIQPAQTVTGRFGICAHRAFSHKASTRVDRWSAGCQVFADPDHWDEFLAIVRYSMRIFGSTVTYSLLEEQPSATD